MDNERFFLHASLFHGFCWATLATITLVFMVKVAGLDPLQMVLVGTVLEATAFALQIPTGLFADVVSRRWSVIIGTVLTGLSFLILGLFPNFGAIVASQIMFGVGDAFSSGAYAAWLTDEVGIARSGDVFLRAGQREQLGSVFGILASVALAQVSLQLPILVGASGILLLSLAMGIWMRETRERPVLTGQQHLWASIMAPLRAGLSEIRRAPLLGIIFAITLAYGAFSEGIDRLFTPFLIGRFSFPVLGPFNDTVWWGVIAIVSKLVGLSATGLARRFINTTSHVALTTGLGLATAVIGLAVIGLANVRSFALTLVFYWLATGLRVAREPLTTTWLNQHLPSVSRATLLSAFAQADAVGQAGGGPIVGYAAKRLSIGVALTASAFLLLPSLLLYHRAARLGGPNEGQA
jgi:DHA3 family tetracycline resistance protein-like MFS transporter